MTLYDLNRSFSNFKVNTLVEIHDIENKNFIAALFTIPKF